MMQHYRGHAIRAVALAIALLLSANAPCAAQSSNDNVYRVEAHMSAGPMTSLFLRTRPLPPGANPVTWGYSATVRVMWHPDQLLSMGFLGGYQLIVAEHFFIADSQSNGHASGSLHAIPLIFDESMQIDGIEVGMGIGAYFLQTKLNDLTTAHSSRIELGSIGHAAYHWHTSKGFHIGAELMASYLPYRGIFSFIPEIDFKYDLLTY